MSMADRDWYRSEAKERHARAHNSADAHWAEAENRPRRPIQLRLPRRHFRLPAQPVALVAALSLLVVMAGRSGVFGAVQQAVQPSALSPAAVPAVPFPSNGYTLLHVRPGPQPTAPLTLQTAPDLNRRWVVTLRDWSTDDLVATVYLEGNSVATVQVPGGQYRLVVANGEEWRGDEARFGKGTEYFQVSDPVALVAYPDHSVGRVIYMMRSANPNMRMVPTTAGDFRTR